MRRVLFLDLDGPVVDVRPRYLSLYRSLVTRAGGRLLADNEYWRLKRERVPEQEILARSGIAPERVPALVQARLDAIESPACLALDRLWPWSLATLEALRRVASLVLVTQRIEGPLARSLPDLGLGDAFEAVLAGRGDRSDIAKADRIRSGGWLSGAESVLVGDTEVDIASARALGIRGVWTRSGIRCDRSMREHAPDAALDDIRGLPAWLENELGWR